MFEWFKKLLKQPNKGENDVSRKHYYSKEIIIKDSQMLEDLYSKIVLRDPDIIKAIVKWWFVSYEIQQVINKKYKRLGIPVPKEFDRYFLNTLKERRNRYDRISSRFTLR